MVVRRYFADYLFGDLSEITHTFGEFREDGGAARYHAVQDRHLYCLDETATCLDH